MRHFPIRLVERQPWTKTDQSDTALYNKTAAPIVFDLWERFKTQRNESSRILTINRNRIYCETAKCDDINF